MSTGREEGFLWWRAQWAGTAKRAGPEIGTGEAVSIFGPFIDPLSLEPTDMREGYLENSLPSFCNDWPCLLSFLAKSAIWFFPSSLLMIYTSSLSLSQYNLFFKIYLALL